MLIGMVGNANSGKSTLFRCLTGSDCHIGNFPGVTVDYQEGTLKCCSETSILDLPGIYSLTPYSEEEKVTKEALQQVDCILNVVDACHLPRHLYLTLQLTELKLPMVIAVNMIDEAKHYFIDYSLLSSVLGVPVIPVSARKNRGISELEQAIKTSAKTPACPVLSHFGEPYLLTAQRRYRYLDWLCQKCITEQTKKKPPFLDRFLLHSPLSFPVLAGVLLLLLFVPFGAPGQWASSMAEQGFAALSSRMPPTLFPWLESLLKDGIFTGVGSVLSFFPSVFLLFLGISLLEDSGYLARISFLLDKPFQTIGLSGRSVLPLLTGFGCTVPALSCAKILPSQRDRYLTLLFLPFVSCSAKLPVYTVITTAIFPRFGFFLIVLLYVSGLLWGLLNTAFSHQYLVKGTSESFVLELPPYRFPNIRHCVRYALMQTGQFIKKIVTVIFLSCLCIWGLQYFTPHLTPALTPSESILVKVATVISPIFTPLGFGTSEATASLLAGLGAKEAVISTLSILTKDGLPFSPLSAFSFLNFVLLYAPCTAAFAAMRKELGTLSALLLFVYQTSFAWLVSFGIYQIGGFILPILG